MGKFIEYLPLIISILSFFGVGTLFSMLWKNLNQARKEKAKENSEAYQLKKKLERQAEVREVIQTELISIKEETLSIKYNIKTIKEDLTLANQGTLAGLRSDILHVFYECQKKGYKNKNDAENFRDLCEAYKKLGGNSFIEHDIIPSFDSLPLSEIPIRRTPVKKVLNENN